MEKEITIGAGTMGKLLTGDKAVSVRQTKSFVDILSGCEFVTMTTEQKAGLQLLRQYSQALSGLIVKSVMAFTPFEVLETAAANDQVLFVRFMTDTSLKTISWSDDGRLTAKQKETVNTQFSKKTKNVVYLGERADEALLAETLKACNLGWLAQALAELTSAVGEETLVKVLEQRQTGKSFADIAKAVATPRGGTEAGMIMGNNLFTRVYELQRQAGLNKGIEKSKNLLNFAKQLL